MYSSLKRLLAAAAFGLVVVLFAGPAARADDAYYMMLFAYQSNPNFPKSAHTFATFIKVHEDEAGKPDLSKVEQHTISWLPATLNVVILKVLPEPGRNLGLQETLKLAAARGANVSAWGPFKIKKDLYDRALTQIGRLERGEISYKALDGANRPGVAHCVHAVSDINGAPYLNSGTAFGILATQMVITHLTPSIIERTTMPPWMEAELGLKRFDVSYRDWPPQPK